MKLPISLLVLAALSQALYVQADTEKSEAKRSVAKSSPAKVEVAKSSPAKQKDNNQTSKRELYEGNFGERNTEFVPKYEVTGPPPKIVYAKEYQNMLSEQSPTHQIFGVRLPQIAKISDVLSGHGPSFEAAVANHLYSPISVYHARLSSPTSSEVPTPATSQTAYSNPNTYKHQADAENEQKMQEVPPKGVELRNSVIPLYAVDQPRHRFEAYPQPLNSGLYHQHENLPQSIFRPQQRPEKVKSSLFPIYGPLGPYRYPGNVVSSQFLHPNGLYQIVPARPDFDYGNQEGNRDKIDRNQENHEQLKGQTNIQIDIPVKQGYHAHPNGAISFTSFTHNLPVSTKYETAPQPQSESFHQPQPTQLQSQPIPVQLPPQKQPEVMLQSQEQKFSPVKNMFQIPGTFDRLMQDLEKYQPVYKEQPQFIPFKQQIQTQPRTLNTLQKHLLFQDPRQLSNTHVIQLQHLPAFKPLPQSLLSPESFLQQTSRSPVLAERPPTITTISPPVAPFSYEDQFVQNSETFDLPFETASIQLTPFSPLKPIHSEFVKPSKSRTTPVFLPTPLQPLPTSIPNQQPASDQLMSSTTIQPNVKEIPKEQLKQKETQTQSQTSHPLKPEITHQSQPTVRPPSIQSTTYLPIVTHEPQSTYFQYSTPRPVYQSTIRPPSPRHEVVIQRQEIQELFLEPSPQPASSRHNQNQQAQDVPQQEREEHQLRTQAHHQLFEQLQPLPFQQEIQDIYSQQYQLEARQSKSPQKPDSSQQGEPQQYLIQHQHESEQTHQQQKGSEQVKQQQQGSQQQQFQQHHLDSKNQIQIFTLKPSQGFEKQTETVKIQQQSESQPQLQQQLNLHPTTGKPKEQPEHLSEPTPNVEQPHLAPLPTSSDLPQIYSHQQQLTAQPKYSPLLRVPSYSDIQYFGKFAESIFGNHHH